MTIVMFVCKDKDITPMMEEAGCRDIIYLDSKDNFHFYV